MRNAFRRGFALYETWDRDRFAGDPRLLVESILKGSQSFLMGSQSFWGCPKAARRVLELSLGVLKLSWRVRPIFGGFESWLKDCQTAWRMPQPGNRQPLLSPLSRAAPAIFAPAHLPPTPRGQWAKSSACTSWAWAAWAFDEVTCANQQAGWEAMGIVGIACVYLFASILILAIPSECPGACREQYNLVSSLNKQTIRQQKHTSQRVRSPNTVSGVGPLQRSFTNPLKQFEIHPTSLRDAYELRRIDRLKTLQSSLEPQPTYLPNSENSLRLVSNLTGMSSTWKGTIAK